MFFISLTIITHNILYVNTLLKKLPSSSPVVSDIKAQVNFYFRPGFLRYAVWHQRYKRYLRGIELRLQRAIANPRQDAVKFSGIEKYVERLTLALDTVPELAITPALYDFVLLFDEMRLSVFAPEVRTVQKVSLDILQRAWDNLRY